MICENCGTEVQNGMRFCGQCGAKVNGDVNIPLERESQTTNELLAPQIDSSAQNLAIDSTDDFIAKHEEATKAPLFSVLGLFSTEGRRRRIPMLKMIFLGGVVCLLPMSMVPPLGYLLSVWLWATNMFKRLHDLDKPNWIGKVFVIVNVFTSIAFFLLGIDPNFQRTSFYRSFGVVFLTLWVAGMLFTLYLLLAPGTKGANRYGRSPEELAELNQLPPQ